MKNKHILIFFLSLNLFSQDFNESLNYIETENQNCLDKGKFMYNCSLEFYNKSDSLLNVVYKNIRKKLTKIEKENFKNKQLKWLKLRNEKFKKINNQDTEQGNELDDLMVKNQYKSDIVNKRTRFLISNYINKKPNKTFSEITKFIPKNYSILDSVKGDLNKDEFDDYILVLRKKDEEKSSKYNENKPEKRHLLILIGNSQGKLELKAENENAVLCIDCSGAIHGDSFEKVVIKNGYFSIEYYTAGGNTKWSRIITFKYNNLEENWFLHKDGTEYFRFNNSENLNSEAIIKTGEEILTVKNFGEIQFEKFNIYK
ncbi:lysozyme inhibitor LprI family protein [Wenyingzhuangia sp. 2_MG-2023]|uniref:lysozyme inhibitor LprI family protein n=1 Tax=Wenyingzhuangia sp. 2_MG-2023 TaxID=3062639 RepID=UPI0026E27A80|nr:lysozyme inhibitor LprI family protein [Wenyingzhuangia sp. 2_MG-2023]MDO6739484.1 hypothetical protein [Wenyingzhuangia sp. 2_MG-2023]